MTVLVLCEIADKLRVVLKVVQDGFCFDSDIVLHQDFTVSGGFRVDENLRSELPT